MTFSIYLINNKIYVIILVWSCSMEFDLIDANACNGNLVEIELAKIVHELFLNPNRMKVKHGEGRCKQFWSGRRNDSLISRMG